jgi:hypothetical protein
MSIPFKVLNFTKHKGCPEFVNWDALNEEQAQLNHYQSLKRLNERGGLDPTEIVANIEKRKWHGMDFEEAIKRIKTIEYGSAPCTLKPNKQYILSLLL